MIHTLILGRRGAGIAALGLLAGCANLPPPPTATLPDRTGGGAILDPARQAIFHTASAFASATPMAGRPAEAAQAISEAEFLAVELRHNSRWTGMSPLAVMAFEQARPEWRGALGIAADAPAQAVIDAMTRVRAAYGGQDLAAAAGALAPPLVTPGGQAALARLAALPPLPRTARAASLAESELWRMQQQGNRDRRWP
jgi:hypothetical protein